MSSMAGCRLDPHLKASCAKFRSRSGQDPHRIFHQWQGPCCPADWGNPNGGPGTSRTEQVGHRATAPSCCVAGPILRRPLARLGRCMMCCRGICRLPLRACSSSLNMPTKSAAKWPRRNFGSHGLDQSQWAHLRFPDPDRRLSAVRYWQGSGPTGCRSELARQERADRLCRTGMKSLGGRVRACHLPQAMPKRAYQTTVSCAAKGQYPKIFLARHVSIHCSKLTD